MQVGASYTAVGFLFGAAGPLALELAAEASFPVAEETAASYMTLGWQLVNVVRVLPSCATSSCLSSCPRSLTAAAARCCERRVVVCGAVPYGR